MTLNACVIIALPDMIYWNFLDIKAIILLGFYQENH